MLDLFEPGTVNFLELAALDTNEMVMVLVAELVLVTQGAVSKIDLPAQARFAYKLYRSGHRRVPDLPVLSSDQVIQLLDGHVLFGSEEHIQHLISLPGAPEPLIGNKLLELLFSVHCLLIPARQSHSRNSLIHIVSTMFTCPNKPSNLLIMIINIL